MCLPCGIAETLGNDSKSGSPHRLQAYADLVNVPFLTAVAGDISVEDSWPVAIPHRKSPSLPT
jgi:hypothetical protein